MGYCVRCGCKTNILNSLNFSGSNTKAICNKCLKELGVPSGSEIVYTHGTYGELLSLVKFHNPELLEKEPGKRKGNDFRDPEPLPEIPSAEQILDEKYLIANPDIRLEKAEKCYASEYVTYSVTYLKTQKINRGYTSVSFNLGHGLHYGIASKNAPKIKKTEEKNFASGKLYLTSDRMILYIKGKYITKFYESIRNIKWNMASFDMDFDDGDSVNISTFSWGKIGLIIELINVMRQENAIKAVQEKARKKQTTRSKNRKAAKNESEEAVKLIRQYKELYDDGIISKEEFEAKKAELLKK